MGLNKCRLQTEQTIGTANGEGGYQNYFSIYAGRTVNGLTKSKSPSLEEYPYTEAMAQRSRCIGQFQTELKIT